MKSRIHPKYKTKYLVSNWRTGLSILGQGEWAAVKHGRSGKRAWKKLQLGVDRSGSIVAEILTNGNANDSNAALNLIDGMTAPFASFTADAAYDTIAIYDVAEARDAKVIVPPRKTAIKSRRPRARDRTARRAMEEGIGVSPAGTRREHLLQIQVNHR
jgi:hypothetical protein